MLSEKPIKEFWLVVLKRSHLRKLIVEEDEKVLKHLIGITSKTTDTTIEITLTFEPCDSLEVTQCTRLIELENKEAVRYKGDDPKFKIPPNPDGLLHKLFTNTSNPKEVSSLFDIVF
jgi:hypothetical protein